jgi:hypothetical protein
LHVKAVQKQKQRVLFLGDEEKATNLSVFGTELARLYPNLNYVLTFDITLKAVREGNTVP